MINSTKIIQYGQQIAFIGVNTLNTGFLTNEIRNSLSKEEASDIVQGTELIVHQIIGQLRHNNEELNEYKFRTLFQYFFDKVAEVTYKTIVGIDIDDISFYVNEAFEYHEPDLPYYIQEKINVIISQTAALSLSTLRYIEQEGGDLDHYEDWLPAYLLLSTSLAMHFVLEMDLDDDLELQEFCEKVF